jgi:hypothetical protein
MKLVGTRMPSELVFHGLCHGTQPCSSSSMICLSRTDKLDCSSLSPFRVVFTSQDAIEEKSNRHTAMYHFKNADFLRVIL